MANATTHDFIGWDCARCGLPLRTIKPCPECGGTDAVLSFEED